ncbi:hypothetical protein [Enterovibrio norvegicus]|uniref:hypothetical protein n=1 Tax=Enterovibrio norvegicus TaxID=188144 RepID=UPI0010549B53|nr:hypothetical protein [Enterovibrio norvegicus]
MMNLYGDAAIELKSKGKKVWNEWVENNPDANVDFSNSTFDENLGDFSGCKFPLGNVSFNSAKFLKGAKFNGAEFKSGLVTFSYATFSGSLTDFRRVDFGDSVVLFEGTIFSSSEVDFSKATFNRKCDFGFAKFETENSSFSEARFNSDTADFSFAMFLGRRVDFYGCAFDCDVLFFQTSFLSHAVDFQRLTSKGQDVSFREARFSDDSVVNFSDSNFDVETLDFSCADFGRHVNMTALNFSERLKSFSLRNSVFKGSLELSLQNAAAVVPDFVGSKTSSHTSLQGLTIKLPTSVFRKANDVDDAHKLRRLKEIAESNKDHEAALRFHADEMRAKRWHSLGTGASLLDAFFDFTSRYGQSIARPVIGLLLCMIGLTLYTVGFAPFTSNWLSNMVSIDCQTWLNGLDVALNKTIPFLGSVKTEGKQAYDALHDSGVLPESYGAVSTLFFALPSFAFLFLIGLGLRNRFRI